MTGGRAVFKAGFLAGAALLAAPAMAQNIEEIVVTGSRLARDPAMSPSPLTVIDADVFAAQGLSSATDIVKFLPVNAGSEFNVDPFTQNLSAGTSNFNLRGLGLNATLVLLNGRRQTLSGGVADDGSTFVDLNALMPLIMLERLEVLKDGAAALYGTDAVAGVANFITRDDYAGSKVQVDYANTARSGQDDLTLSGLFGTGAEKWHVTAAASYLRRSWMPATERDFTAGKASSSFGQPGAFILLEQSPLYPNLPFGTVNPQPIIDPACGIIAGSTRNPRAVQPANIGPFQVGTCTFDFAGYYHLVSQERRWTTYATARVDVGDDAELFAEAGFADGETYRGTSPSFPLLTAPTVPANNPGNIFGVPVLFQGRALGSLTGGDHVLHTSRTWRGVVGARGALARDWNWEASVASSANDFYVGINDALSDRFTAALNGTGGPNNTQYFNPFGTAVNDPAVIGDFISTNTYDYDTSLTVADASVTGALFDLPAGTVDLAVGAQYRRDRVTGDHNDFYNAEDYIFFIGGPDFAGTSRTWAAFSEARVPVTGTLEVQLALRHENYNGGLSSTDPKAALLWRPNDAFTARASYSTSFRAPSAFQRFSVQMVQTNIMDPVAGSTAFRAIRTIGDEMLKPEQAEVMNAGVTLTPMERLQVSADYWRFDYTDIIIKLSPQAIVNANPFDPRIIRSLGQIQRIDTSYINASSALTDGVDVSARYALDDVTLGAEATYIHKFMLQETPTSAKVDVAGSRNFLSFARSLPRWRGNVSAGWEKERHGATAALHYIGDYRDDQNGNRRIRPHVTLDAQYSYTLPPPRDGADESPSLAVGVVNLFDRNPPALNTNGGYDSKVHDPRGRVLYVRVTAPW